MLPGEGFLPYFYVSYERIDSLFYGKHIARITYSVVALMAFLAVIATIG